MSQGRDLLRQVGPILQQEFAIPFTVEGYSKVFTGLCEEVQHGNELGAGGFKLTADATLRVELSEFAAAGLTPAAGMRIRVYGVPCLVIRVGINDLRWNLTLEADQTQTG